MLSQIRRLGVLLTLSLALSTPAFAQNLTTYVGANGSDRVLVTPSVGLPVNCITGCTAGGGGSASPFTPTGVTTKISAGSGSSVSGALSATGPNLMVYNSGTNPAWVTLGVGSATAAVGTSYYIPAGQTLALVSGTNTYLAGYGVGGSTDLNVTPGSGQPLGWGGGGGGSTSVAATTSPTTWTNGSTANQLNGSTKGGLRIQPITPAGADFDLSAPAALVGVDGVNIATALNPVPASINGTVPLPTGASTSALQTTANTTLTAINTALASSLPLPTGGATSALQTTGNTALSSIITALNTPFQAGGSIGNTSFGATQGAGNTSNAWTMQGPVATTVAASGNPVPVGGDYLGTAPTYSAGARSTLQVDTKGNLEILLNANATTGADGVPNSLGYLQRSDARGTNLITAVADWTLNGATWDRNFTCTNTAPVNVTAGSTTEIVSLTAATTIRVCSLALGISANGSFGIYYGTGTNCGTGTAAIVQDIPLNTGTPFQQATGGGGSLFRGASANAVCVKAVTGNVTGYMTYAKF